MEARSRRVLLPTDEDAADTDQETDSEAERDAVKKALANDDAEFDVPLADSSEDSDSPLRYRNFYSSRRV